MSVNPTPRPTDPQGLSGFFLCFFLRGGRKKLLLFFVVSIFCCSFAVFKITYAVRDRRKNPAIFVPTPIKSKIFGCAESRSGNTCGGFAYVDLEQLVAQLFLLFKNIQHECTNDIQLRR